MSYATSTFTPGFAIDLGKRFFEVSLAKTEYIASIVLQFPKITRTYRFVVAFDNQKFITAGVATATGTSFICSPTHTKDSLLLIYDAGTGTAFASATSQYIEFAATATGVNKCEIFYKNLSTNKARFLCNTARLYIASSSAVSPFAISEIRPVVQILGDDIQGQTMELENSLTIRSNSTGSDVLQITASGVAAWSGANNAINYTKLLPTGLESYCTNSDGVATSTIKIGLLGGNVYGAWLPRIYIGGPSYACASVQVSDAGAVNITTTDTGVGGTLTFTKGTGVVTLSCFNNADLLDITGGIRLSTGAFFSGIIPNTDVACSLGSATHRWLEIYTDNAYVTTQTTSPNLVTENVYHYGCATAVIGHSSTPYEAYLGKLHIRGNGIWEEATNDVSEVAINYWGYASGTTTFRNFSVYDGKNVSCFAITGSSKQATFSGAILASSALTITGATLASGTFGVLGASTFTSSVLASSTLGVLGISTFSGAVKASSTLTITGAFVASSTAQMIGASTFNSSATITAAGQFSCAGPSYFPGGVGDIFSILDSNYYFGSATNRYLYGYFDNAIGASVIANTSLVSSGTLSVTGASTLSTNVSVVATNVGWGEGVNIDSANGTWGGVKFRTVGRTGNVGNWHFGYDATHSGAADSPIHIYGEEALYVASFYQTGAVKFYGAATISGSLTCSGTFTGYTKSYFYSANQALNTGEGNLTVLTTNTATIEVGGQIGIGGYYNGTTDWTAFGTIKGVKENVTAGNYNGALIFGVNTHGTGVNEKMRITSTGYINHVATSDVTITNCPFTTYAHSTNAIAAGMGAGIALGGVYTGSSHTVFGFIGAQKENATDNNYAGKLVFGTRQDASGGADMTRMTILSSGNVGIGTTAPLRTLHVNGEFSLTNASAASPKFLNISDVTGNGNTTLNIRGLTSNGVVGTNATVNITGTLAVTSPASTNAITGTAQTANYAGVYGYNLSGNGVYGYSAAAASHAGVRGVNYAGTGVYGQASATAGYGVYGINKAGHGIRGDAVAAGYAGVYGYNVAAGYGVCGICPTGYGVYGYASNIGYYGVHGANSLGTGVYGYSNAASYYGVYGINNAGHGIRGDAVAANYAGVYGYNLSGNGVYGYSAAAASHAGVWGVNYAGTGVYGQASATAGYGVYAINSIGIAVYGYGGYASAIVGAVHGDSIAGTGVVGRCYGSDGNGLSNMYGVYAKNINGYALYAYASNTNYAGVYGYNALGTGVYGISAGVGRNGVYGYSPTGYGVYGYASNTGYYGVHGTNSLGTGVHGISAGVGRSGVYGENTVGYGVFGASTGAGYAAIYGTTVACATCHSGYFDGGKFKIALGGTTLGNLIITNWHTSASTSYAVHTDGTNLWYVTSSIRFKQNVRDLVIDQRYWDLKPRWYQCLGSNVDEIGAIAEEIFMQYPCLVPLDKDGLPGGVAYERLGILAIAATHQLKKTSDEDRIAFQEHKKEYTIREESMIERIAKLEEMVATLMG